MAILEIKGQLDTAQFWPTGSSDADTTTLRIAVGADAIGWRPRPGAKLTPTRAYQGALAGAGQPVIDQGKVTVRLQGVDAPELHARPRSNKELGSLAGTGTVKDYRQAQGETAAAALGTFLKSRGALIECRFVSVIDDAEGPAGAIDMFGRFVGDLRVGPISVNHWLLENGRALPAIYTGMDPAAEITPLLQAWQVGRRRGIAPYYRARIGSFSPQRVFRRGGPVQAEGTAGYILPKLFRRQVTWWAYRKAGLLSQSFTRFLAEGSDQCLLLADYLASRNSAHAYSLAAPQIVKGGVFLPAPEGLVFKEAASSLYRRVEGRKVPVEDW